MRPIVIVSTTGAAVNHLRSLHAPLLLAGYVVTFFYLSEIKILLTKPIFHFSLIALRVLPEPTFFSQQQWDKVRKENASSPRTHS